MGKRVLFYVGSYTQPILHGTGKILIGRGKGIYIIELDIETGTVTDVREAAEADNPSFLCISPCRGYLYSVNELKSYEGKPQGAVSAYRIRDKGNLEFLNKKPTYGTDPCHLSTSFSGKYLAVSNFMSGSLCMYHIGNGGAISDEHQFIQHEGSGIDRIRQNGPHAHAAIFDKNDGFLLVPDLGIDKVMVYRIDRETGRLSLAGDYSVRPGSGPRYCEFHPALDICYLINELDSSISVFRYDAGKGELALMQTVPTVDAEYKRNNICAALHVSPDGKFLYASNRGHDSIASYSIDEKGMLTFLDHRSSGGKTPRHFALESTGKYLLVANQDSDNITVFVADRTDGSLSVCSTIEIPTPVCVCEL